MYDIIVYIAGRKKNKRYILISVGKWKEKFHLFGNPTENFSVSSKYGMFLRNNITIESDEKLINYMPLHTAI